MGEILNLANTITLFRIVVLAPIAVFFIADGNTAMAAVVIVIFFILDKADGYTARKFSQVTEIGKVLDGYADTIGLFIILSYFYLNSVLSLWESFVVIFPRMLTDASAVLIKLQGRGMVKTRLLQAHIIALLLLFIILYFTRHNNAVLVVFYIIMYALSSLHLAEAFRRLYFKAEG